MMVDTVFYPFPVYLYEDKRKPDTTVFKSLTKIMNS
jgi:hypothetical protein